MAGLWHRLTAGSLSYSRDEQRALLGRLSKLFQDDLRHVRAGRYDRALAEISFCGIFTNRALNGSNSRGSISAGRRPTAMTCRRIPRGITHATTLAIFTGKPMAGSANVRPSCTIQALNFSSVEPPTSCDACSYLRSSRRAMPSPPRAY